MFERILELHGFVDAWRHRAQDERTGITFVQAGDRFVERSYAELFQSASVAASFLRSRGLGPGREVLLQVADPETLLTMMHACWLLGACPVPLAVGGTREHLHKVKHVWSRCQAPFLLAEEAALTRILRFLRQAGVPEVGLRRASQAVEHMAVADVHLPWLEFNPQAPVLIQYSSGSTGNPKGVTLDFQALVANTHAILNASGSTDNDCLLSWMPLTHDMGLIGVHLTAFFAGLPQVLMPTQLFVRRPTLWMSSAERFRATQLYAPNFGYRHFLNAYDGQTHWNLSQVRLIYNGAEPIHEPLCREFLEALRPSGLGPETMFPVYGLAEATLAVSIPEPGQPYRYVDIDAESLVLDRDSEMVSGGGQKLRLLKLGKPVAGMEIAIRDREGNELAEGGFGLIHIRGGSVTRGYYGDPEATAKVLDADGWLNTGDVGAFFDGDLVVAGRMGECIYANGQNIFPQDIERILEAGCDIAAGHLAVTSVFDEALGCDRLLVCVRHKGDSESFLPTVHQIREVVARESGLDMPWVLPVKRIPKTTSGKVQRLKLRQAFLDGELKAALEALDRLEGKKRIGPGVDGLVDHPVRRIMSRVLSVELGENDLFFQHGLTSIKAFTAAGLLAEALQVDVTARDLFECGRVNALRTRLEARPKIDLVEAAVDPVGDQEARAAERRIYFLSQAAGEEDPYHITLSLEGDQSHRERMRQVVDAWICRHPNLRTTYAFEEGRLKRIVHPYLPVDWRVCEPGPIQKCGFDLNHGPLFRVYEQTLEEGRLRLLLDFHHIIVDGPSISLLLAEAAESFLGGSPRGSAGTSHGPVRRHLPSAAHGNPLNYWRDLFSQGVPGGDLPTDHLRRDQPGKARRLRRSIPHEQVVGLKNAAARFGMTPYMILLTAYGELLGRYQGSRQVVIGVPITARRDEVDQKTVGLMVHTLPLLMDLAPELTVAQRFQAVRAACFNAFNHADLALEELIEALGFVREPGRHPLFDTMFALRDFAVPADFPFEVEEFAPIFSKFDWTLELVVEGDAYSLDLEYNADLFHGENMEPFLEQLLELCGTMTADPDQIAANIPLAASVLHGPDAPASRALDALFLETAAQHGERQAVVYPGGSLTYRELAILVSRLAARLRAQGLEPGESVALELKRGPFIPLAMLAVLLAGGRYLPLDPGHPRKRRRWMVRDAGARFLVCDGESDLDLPSIQLGTADLDAGLPDPCIQPIADHGRRPAYIMYTSGSTGVPKGAELRHENVSRVVRDNGYLQIQPEDRIWQLSNYAFDGAVFDIYGALLNGAALVVVDEDHAGDAALLGRFLREQRITVGFMTTALFNTLVDLDPQALAGPRALLFGGERVSPAHVRRAVAVTGPGRLIHVYGPTETCVFACAATVNQVAESALAVPIGKPIAGTKLQVRDRHGNPLPVGQPGELLIGGSGLADGYRNHPDLSEERFLKEGSAGERWYRSGDWVRILADGQVEFLERMDFQVKIRGHRVEIGEIENHVQGFPGINEVIVTARADAYGQNQLHAYFTAGEIIDPLILRRYLQRALPEYMVPVQYVQLERFPLTPNGKICRVSLPEVDMAPMAGNERIAPRNHIEHRLAVIWRDVLKLEEVGIHDHFFELGGHSLKASWLTNRIQSEFGIHVPVREIFRRPTIEAQAGYIELNLSAAEVELGEKAPDRARMPLSSAQKRLFFLDRFETVGTAYNMPGCLEIRGPLSRKRLENALSALVDRHESLRTYFALDENGEPYQAVVEEIAFQTEYDQNQDPAQLEADFVRPFALDQAPLFRARLLKIDEDRHNLYLDLHHIIADGISLTILIADFCALYRGEALEMPHWTYRDFTHEQNKQLAEGKHQSDERYWLQRFADDIPVLALPGDYPRPRMKRFEGGRLDFRLDDELSQSVRRLAGQHGATVYMVLLAAYSTFLHRLCGQEDIVIGTPVSGRTNAKRQNLIGMFVNTLPLRLHPRADQRFSAHLNTVKNQVLEGLEHQDLPFEYLVDKLHVRRDLSRNPLFDVGFSLQRHEGNNFDIDGLEFKTRRLGPVTAKFDLHLNMEEDARGFNGCFEYAQSIFSAETIAAFGLSFLRLLRSLCSDPETELADLCWLNGDGHPGTHINQSRRIYQKEATIIDRFRQMVALRGKEPALWFMGRSLSYQELDKQSDQLAVALQQLGLGADQVVALCRGRGFELIIGILGILKAGGTYLPLDPEHPDARLQFQIQDAGARFVLGSEGSAERFPESQVYNLQDLITQGQGTPQAVFGRNAYVIYTSGSSGKPKGVLINHRAVLNLCTANPEIMPCRGDRVLQVSNAVFDGSVFDIFGALLNGAELVLLKREDFLSTDRLAKVVAESRADQALFPTALLHNLIEVDLGAVSGLKRVLFGGEAARADLIAKAFDQLGPGRLINLYGPTEACVCVSAMVVHQRPDVRRPLPVGKPLANTKLYVVDHKQQVQPVGVPGELCIAGDGLTAGYLNRPRLNADKFRGNRIEGNGRLYYSGDRAKYLADGSLVILGRLDEQVKVRGYRIEPGEIERTAREHLAVEQAVVQVREYAGSPTLCLWYTGPQPVDDLKSFMRKHLPDYMVPSHLVHLNQLPLNRSGKVDRKSLPDPVRDNQRRISLPRNERETRLAAMWCDILGLEEVGICENFFDLGGNSLLIMKLHAYIEREYPGRLSVTDLFSYPNIAAQAECLADSHVEPIAACRVPADFFEIGAPLGGFDIAIDEETHTVLSALAEQAETPVHGVLGALFAHLLQELGVAEPLSLYFSGKGERLCRADLRPSEAETLVDLAAAVAAGAQCRAHDALIQAGREAGEQRLTILVADDAFIPDELLEHFDLQLFYEVENNRGLCRFHYRENLNREALSRCVGWFSAMIDKLAEIYCLEPEAGE